MSIGSTHIKAHRSTTGAKGADFQQAVGRSRGGRTTKIHALTEDRGRPVAFLITPGNCHDLPAARDLLPTVPPPRRLQAERAYDANSLRDWLAARGVKPVIPPNPSRKHPHRYDAKAYKGRNLIERMFRRLKGLQAYRHRQMSRYLPVTNPLGSRTHLVDQLSPDPSSLFFKHLPRVI